MKLKSGDRFDIVVVGAGLAGLLAAAFQVKNNKSVLLLEALDQYGGRYSPTVRSGMQFGAGFAFQDGQLYRDAFKILGLEVDGLHIENGGALQHSTRGWQPVEKEELPEWEAYLIQPSTFYPKGGLARVEGQLLDYCQGSERFTLATSSPVTAVEVTDGKAQKLVVGSDKEIHFNEIIWAAGFKQLLTVLTGNSVPEAGAARVSWLRKYSRTSSTPGVVIEFAHKQKVTDFTETLVLPFQAGEKEERRYLVGAFVGNRDESLAPAGKQVSSWILPLTEFEWDENHETMKKIRSAHRMLDKAFAGFEASVDFDRVLVLEHTITPLAKRKSESQPLFENFRIASDWAASLGATNEGVLDHFIGQCDS